MELNKKNMKRIAILIAFGIVLYLMLKNISGVSAFFNFLVGVFEPLLLGMALAFILNVLMRQVETVFFAPLNRRYKKRWPKARRPLSILITILIVLGIIALIMQIFVPELINTVTSLTKNVPTFFGDLQHNIAITKKKYPLIGKYISKININWPYVSQMLQKYGQKFGSTLVNSTVSVAANVAHAVITLILGIVFAINILTQKEKLKSQVKRVMYAYLPKKPTDIFVKVFNLTNHAFSNFIVGQCTEACILGTLCFIGMSIFRFPYALLVSALVAFNAFIPIFGAFLSVSVGALLIMVVNPIQAIWFIIFFVVLQQVEGNFIFPRVVGSKVGLPALWVLAAITIGGNTFGLVGMIVNIPICSVLYTLLREDVKRRQEKLRLKDKPLETGS